MSMLMKIQDAIKTIEFYNLELIEKVDIASL